MSANEYARAGEMTVDIPPVEWADAGTHASKLKASILVALAKGIPSKRKEQRSPLWPDHMASAV
jgi:hypothetical protein